MRACRREASCASLAACDNVAQLLEDCLLIALGRIVWRMPCSRERLRVAWSPTAKQLRLTSHGFAALSRCSLRLPDSDTTAPSQPQKLPAVTSEVEATPDPRDFRKTAGKPMDNVNRTVYSMEYAASSCLPVPPTEAAISSRLPGSIWQRSSAQTARLCRRG